VVHGAVGVAPGWSNVIAVCKVAEGIVIADLREAREQTIRTVKNRWGAVGNSILFRVGVP
jgi:hypothetical protein